MVVSTQKDHMKLYNTASRSVEDFVPMSEGKVGLYACGFTVYDYTHLGHLRKYTFDDVLVKTLRARGFDVKFVQNVTDVGHLTSDEDTGEDKLEKGARKYGKSVWDVAHEFEEYFWYSMELMGVLPPDVSCRATDHIEQQLAMVLDLEKKGFTYAIEDDGVYFDTSRFPEYGQMARLDIESLQSGARVEMLAGKRNPTDFALWKFERPGENRAMVWPSPWAQRSFPGWHIECSAMAMEYLGPQFDIHTGGIDHIPVHHTNEIAQAEAMTGKKPFVKYWVHHNHLHIEGQKMSKSLGNFFTIDDVLEKGFHPRALRLLFLTSHYHDEQNFTWDALAAAQKQYQKLVAVVRSLQADQDRTVLSEDKLAKVDQYRERFYAALENDLATPEAVALLQEVIKSNIPGTDKYDLLIEFDEILGLGLRSGGQQTVELPQLLKETTHETKRVVQLTEEELFAETDERLPEQIRQLAEQRSAARQSKDWAASDQLRQQLAEQGYDVEDGAGGQQLKKRG
jgi:cysteinyl-tRNA synthetase